MSKDHGQCLTEDALTEYLEGGLDPALKAATEVHLIACNGCRKKLGYFMRILRQDITGEEATLIQALSERESDKRKSKTQARAGWFSYFLVPAAIVAGLVLAVVGTRQVWNYAAAPRNASAVVQLLLAQSRPFESRMASEPYLPIVRTRGNEQPAVSYGPLAAEMTRLSANSHEMGRFYLLQKDFDRAIPYLEMAAREIGASPAVHNDLGVAYLESGNAARLENASDKFRQALEHDPSFADAAFNLALFYERTGELAQAEAQWKRYLGLDSRSDWAMEARGRLQGLSR